MRSFVDYCNLSSLSYFILFVDLSKAFYYVIRGILVGWRQGFSGDELRHLMRLGLSEHHAKVLMKDLVENAGVLQHLGCDAALCEMVNSLQTDSRCRYADCSAVIFSNRGGRQGC